MGAKLHRARHDFCMYAITGQLWAGTTRTTQSYSSVHCENVICQVVTLINEVMMDLKLLELAAIAVALDEEGAERKRR